MFVKHMDDSEIAEMVKFFQNFYIKILMLNVISSGFGPFGK